MKATEQYVPVFSFNATQAGSNFWVCLKIETHSVTTQMKATRQYFPVALFIML